MTAQADMALAQSRQSAAFDQAARVTRAGKPGESKFARILAADPVQDKKLKESCQQMESLLLKQMISSMRKTVEKSGFIDGGQAEEIFSDMLYDQYAGEMSRSKTFGLSKVIYEQLSGGKKWI